ncbi:MAG: hypothetical protein V1777_00350 [Candidatus Micrarchaeota archaeon]
MMDPRWKRLLLLFGFVAVLFAASLFLSSVFSFLGTNEPVQKTGAFEFGFSTRQLDALGSDAGTTYEQKMLFLRDRMVFFETGDASQKPVAAAENISIVQKTADNQTDWFFHVPVVATEKNYSFRIALGNSPDIVFDFPTIKESDLS